MTPRSDAASGRTWKKSSHTLARQGVGQIGRQSRRPGQLFSLCREGLRQVGWTVAHEPCLLCYGPLAKEYTEQDSQCDSRLRTDRETVQREARCSESSVGAVEFKELLRTCGPVQ